MPVSTYMAHLTAKGFSCVNFSITWFIVAGSLSEAFRKAMETVSVSNGNFDRFQIEIEMKGE